MPNEEIIGGLKIALEKGQSLQDAMSSFLSSGYTKEEIEEAARALSRVPLVQEQPSMLTQTEVPVKKFPKLSLPFMHKSPEQASQMPVPDSSQKISAYGTQQSMVMQKPKPKILIFFLIFLLVFFISLLVTIFIFKDDLISFFANLSG